MSELTPARMFAQESMSPMVSGLRCLILRGSFSQNASAILLMLTGSTSSSSACFAFFFLMYF